MDPDQQVKDEKEFLIVQMNQRESNKNFNIATSDVRLSYHASINENSFQN